MISRAVNSRHFSGSGNGIFITSLVAIAMLFLMNYSKTPLSVVEDGTNAAKSQHQPKHTPEVLPDDLIYGKNSRSAFVIPVSFFFVALLLTSLQA